MCAAEGFMAAGMTDWLATLQAVCHASTDFSYKLGSAHTKA